MLNTLSLLVEVEVVTAVEPTGTKLVAAVVLVVIALRLLVNLLVVAELWNQHFLWLLEPTR
jgi:hypothetical protein